MLPEDLIVVFNGVPNDRERAEFVKQLTALAESSGYALVESSKRSSMRRAFAAEQRLLDVHLQDISPLTQRARDH